MFAALALLVLLALAASVAGNEHRVQQLEQLVEEMRKEYGQRIHELETSKAPFSLKPQQKDSKELESHVLPQLDKYTFGAKPQPRLLCSCATTVFQGSDYSTEKNYCTILLS